MNEISIIAQFVTVERRIAPPPAVPERSVPVSEHSAPQCPDAGHAYRAGDSPHAPVSSHRGSVHAARGGLSRVRYGDRHRYGQFQSALLLDSRVVEFEAVVY